MNQEPDEALDEIAAAIADGKTIDWGRMAKRYGLSKETLTALRTVAAMRQIDESEPSEPGRPEDRALLETGFEILEELGRGSFATVYRARDKALGREVALKVLREDLEVSEERRKQFVEEARALASLDHANVVRIHSIETKQGRLILCLECIEGRTLEDTVRADGPLAPQEAARIGVEVCRALAAIHAAGLVHSDVKPSNVMRATQGRIVLLDFGLARSGAAAAGEGAGALAGTPRFFAPEQFEDGEEVGPSADLFALGVVLYWLVAERFPFEAETFQELREQVLASRVVPLSDCRPDVPPAFQEILERALAPLSARFSSAGELEQALRSFLAGSRRDPTHDVAGKQGSNSTSGLPGRRTILVLAALGVAAVFLGDRLFEWTIGGGATDPFERGFSLEARFVAGPAGNVSEVDSGDRVAPGHLLALDLESNRDLYVYVFNEDATGERHTLFPMPEIEPGNPWPAGLAYRLPGHVDGEQKYWRFTSSGGGAEELLIVASLDPVPEAEEYARVNPYPTEDAPIEDASPEEKTRAWAKLRGVGGITSGKGPTQAADDASSGELEDLFLELEQETIQGAGVVTRRVRLINRTD